MRVQMKEVWQRCKKEPKRNIKERGRKEIAKKGMRNNN